MRKQDRHRLITRLLTEKNIQKQEDFVNYLQEKGVAVTQATISRDIKDMKLIKVPSAEGGYRYSLPLETQANTSAKLAKLLKDAFVAAEQMEKYVVLRTCGSLIEKNYQEKLFAVINDDDSVLMIARTEEAAEKLHKELLSYL